MSDDKDTLVAHLQGKTVDKPKILGPAGTPIVGNDAPVNQLILTDKHDDGIKKPYQHWQAEVDRRTVKGTMRPFDFEKGFSDDLQYGANDNDLTPPEKTLNSRSLPPDFCPMCDKFGIPTTVKKERAITIFRNDYPGLGIKPGDSVEYYCCQWCVLRNVTGEDDDSVIDTDYAPRFRWDEKRNKAVIIEERIVAYMQERHAVGDRGSAVYGDETRKERFAHEDEKIDD